MKGNTKKNDELNFAVHGSDHLVCMCVCSVRKVRTSSKLIS